jgi:hypothetical protein
MLWFQEKLPSTTIGLWYFTTQIYLWCFGDRRNRFSFYYHWITIYLHSPYYLICSPSTTIGLRNISFYYHWITIYLLSPYYLICSPSTTIGLRYISTLILSHMFSFYYHWIMIYLHSPYYLICSPSTTIRLRYISTLHTISYVLLLLPLDYDISPLSILSHMWRNIIIYW